MSQLDSRKWPNPELRAVAVGECELSPVGD